MGLPWRSPLSFRCKLDENRSAQGDGLAGDGSDSDGFVGDGSAVLGLPVMQCCRFLVFLRAP